MKIQFIGTSGSAITETETYSSILIDDTILLDCGEGTTQKLIKLKVIDKINLICITHLHNDHFLGIFSLLWYYWIMGRSKKPLLIIGPPNIKSTINTIFDLINTPKNVFNFEIRYRILKDDNTIQLFEFENYIIKALKMEHNPISFAYRVYEKNSEKSITYTGDTKPNDRLILLAENSDILISESTFPDKYSVFAHKYNHCTPKDAAILANKSKSKMLIITHISALFKKEKERDKFIDEAKRIYKNKIIIAKDLLNINI